MVYRILGYTEFIIIFVNIVVVASSCKSKITYTVLICEKSVQRWLLHLLWHNYMTPVDIVACAAAVPTPVIFNTHHASVFLPLHPPKARVLLCSDCRGSAGVLVH